MDEQMKVEALRKLRESHERAMSLLTPRASRVEEAMLPPPGWDYLEIKYQQELAVIEEFGELRQFNWMVTDATGRSIDVQDIGSQIEATYRAEKRWADDGYQPKTPLTAVRYDTAFPARYRMTPERSEILRRVVEANDRTAPRPSGGLPMPPPNATWLENKWAEEDAVIHEFGYLRTFRWTVTDAAGHSQEVRNVATSIEAEKKAHGIWCAAKYQYKAPLTTIRHEE